MNDRLKKIGPILGYSAFFIFALLLFVRLTFPTNAARDFIEDKLVGQFGVESVEMRDLSLRGLIPSGARAKDLQISFSPLEIKTPERGVDIVGPPRQLLIDDLTIDAALMGLTRQDFDIDLSGEIAGGRLEGAQLKWPKGGTLDAKIDAIRGIELGPEALFQTLTGLHIVATMHGDLQLAIPSEEKGQQHALAFDKAEGHIGLQLQDTRILDPILDTDMNGEPVRLVYTDTSLGTVTLNARIDGNAGPSGVGARSGTRARSAAIVIDEFSASGGHIEIAMAPNARITLRPGMGLGDAILNLHLAVKIHDSWFEIEKRHPNDPDKMEQPNIGLRTMFTVGPLKNHLQDGQFGVRIMGRLANPRINLETPKVRVEEGQDPGPLPTDSRANPSPPPSPRANSRANRGRPNRAAAADEPAANANPANDDSDGTDAPNANSANEDPAATPNPSRDLNRSRPRPNRGANPLPNRGDRLDRGDRALRGRGRNLDPSRLGDRALTPNRRPRPRLIQGQDAPPYSPPAAPAGADENAPLEPLDLGGDEDEDEDE